jgi:hypothetical protein
MKIHELKRNDNFKAYLHDPGTDEKCFTISGKFLKMDGMYAQVMLHGVGQVQFLSANMEVEKVKGK